MRYENKSIGFSFELPEGWRLDERNLILTFFGPNGQIGYASELIQMQIGTILPQYLDSDSREKFLAEPGAEAGELEFPNIHPSGFPNLQWSSELGQELVLGYFH